MSRVMAVSFERYGRLYYLDAADSEYRVGDKVLYPTEYGPEVAECVWAPEYVDSADFADSELPRCGGRAEQTHLDRDAANRRARAQAKLVAKKLIKSHGLAMKVAAVDLVDSGIDFDQLIVIYFTAPQRVDFRVLVSELARSLRSRIDLRQIGARDAARLTGGLGNCGRELCCATFLSNVEPVQLRMAKVQDLPANPLRISGACGRLMCCLKYEHPLYVEFAREAPPVGAAVTTDEGDGVVVGHSVPADTIQVRLGESGAVSSCAKASVCGSRGAYESRTGESTAPSTGASTAPSTGEPTPESPGGDALAHRTRTRRRR